MRHWKDLILPVGFISSLLVMLVPLPTPILDLLLSANVSIAVIVLLTTIFVKSPLEFSVFPSLLLATTLGRLVLNLATTRLILTEAGSEGPLAAGGVVKAFGEFVAGNDVFVGIIIFAIIVVIQFVVITKGATRISEVAARFALDGMPGRQMAIDQDFNAGIIDEHEAKRRREEVTRHADFYAAMDGASKFVRGDAVAGIIITLINIAGGFVIGVVQDGMEWAAAAELFTKLTIGDGLASQVPAFLISLAAALLVTRSTASINLPRLAIAQLFSKPQALAVAAVFLGALALTDLPRVPLISVGLGCGGIALVLQRRAQEEATQSAATEQQKEKAAAAPPPERIEDYLAIDPMEIELGASLLKLADPARGGDLLARITGVRQMVAQDIGMVLPKVRIRDNLQLGSQQYRIKIANNPFAEGHVYPDRLLAMSSGNVTGIVPGEKTKDPAFGYDALWIEPGVRDRAEMLGYIPVEPSAVVATHLQQVAIRHADELLTRDAAKHLIDELKKTSPAVVDELIPSVMKLAEVQEILHSLLREEVPIRQLGLILETLGDYAGRIKDPIWLTEYVRSRLGRTICSRYCDADKVLWTITLDPALADRIAAGIEQKDGRLFVRMSPPAVQKTCELIAAEAEKLTRQGKPAVLLVSPQIRPGVKHLAGSSLPRLVVLGFNEVPRDTKIEVVGNVAEAAPRK